MAGVKIQLEYDVLRGQFLHVQVSPGNRNDKTYGTTCLKTVESGDLCLPDLGYFDLKEHKKLSSCHPSSFDRKTNPNTVTQSNDL